MTQRWRPADRLTALVAVVLVLLVVLVLYAAFGTGASREAVLLTVNDVYRIEGVDRVQGLEGGGRGGLARLRALRRELERRSPDLLVLHAGDLLFPSLLSDTYDGQQMVEMMNLLDGMEGSRDERLFVTFGNHEFDEDGAEGAATLLETLAGSEFRWLDSNLVWGEGFDAARLEEADVLHETALVESGGLTIGLFGVTTDSKHPDYVRTFLDPTATAGLLSRRLRERGADVVVALTHLAIGEDREILERLGADGPDLIVGGHEHERHVEEVDGRWIVKADAEARTAGVVRIRLVDGRPDVSVSFRFLGPETPEPDTEVAEAVEEKLAEHEKELCQEEGKVDGCLGVELTTSEVRLVAEELEVRRYETNIGSWVADRAREALDADVAFVNAGALRLNQDVPPGPVTERHLRELFPYDNEVVRLEITGEVLQQVVNRAVEEWTGEGHFLQVSGFAFRHDAASGLATDLTLLREVDGVVVPEPIAADTELTAATFAYVAGGGDDYDCLRGKAASGAAPVADFVGYVRSALEAAETIAPELEGRICNSGRPEGPCLAVEPEVETGPDAPVDPCPQRLTAESCRAE